LALYLRNNPAFVVGLLGAWKAGGAAVEVSPMNKERELAYLLGDSGARALLCLDSLYATVSASPADVASIPTWAPAPGDVAVLTYTSGTTGQPKGAMNTHAGLVHGSCTYREWMNLTPADSVLGIAPLFHITGLIAHVCLSLLLPCPGTGTGRRSRRRRCPAASCGPATWASWTQTAGSTSWTGRRT
jgi:long-chain acyl-CoA synthetase